MPGQGYRQEAGDMQRARAMKQLCASLLSQLSDKWQVDPMTEADLEMAASAYTAGVSMVSASRLL